MNKPLAVISAPVDTYSGYGARARDFVKSLVKVKGDEWDIRVLPQRWGNTRFGYLVEHNEQELRKLLIPKLESKPKVWIQITVPNEFQPVGEYNIGVTAAMETTLCHSSWVEGVNRMNLVLASSEHSKSSLVESKYEYTNKDTGQKGQLEVAKPVEVLFEGVDLSKYNIGVNNDSIQMIETLDEIKESFCFLFVGHWLQGEHGQDRKNVGRMIETFLNTFKTQRQKPALIIKTQHSTSCIMDREAIFRKIDLIRKSVGGSLPNIYLLHGEVNDKEINTLYNHNKVKAMVCLTKGEGFGRPMLEFTTTGKPLIASAWSGHVDFLRSDLVSLIGGKLNNVDPSAVIKDMILPEAKWFDYDDKQAREALKFTFKHYKKAKEKSKRQRTVTTKHYTIDNMTEKLSEYLDKYVPFFPVQSTFKAPLPQKIELPKKPVKL